MAPAPDCSDPLPVTGSRAARLAVAVAVLAATGLLAASAVAKDQSERSLGTLNQRVLVALNRFRVTHGLLPLRESEALDSSAREHSLEMGRLGYFGHPSADAKSFWRRIGSYYPSDGHGYWSVGENLLWRSPSVSAGRAMEMWIASPEHLRNLLATRWRRIGISAVRVAHGPGVYHGLPVTIITTDFGVRR
jgi:uncharacterized protein YkwD